MKLNIRKAIKRIINEEISKLNDFPSNWRIIEEYDEATIFEDDNGYFNITIDYNKNYDTYEIWFNQMKGDLTLVKSYTTISDDKEDAIEEAKKMANYINNNLPNL